MKKLLNHGWCLFLIIFVSGAIEGLKKKEKRITPMRTAYKRMMHTAETVVMRRNICVCDESTMFVVKGIAFQFGSNCWSKRN